MDEENERYHRLTVQIADVQPFKLQIRASEETFYRQIIEQLNKLWLKIHYGPGGAPSSIALAKVALYYAEMAHRKAALANDQSKALADFEEQLDKMLRDMEL